MMNKDCNIFMKIATIEEKVIKAADDALAREVDAWLSVYKYCTSDYLKPFSVEVGGDLKTVTLQHRGYVWPLIRALIIESLTPDRRKKALNDFMDKVDKLSKAYEELGLYQEECAQRQEQ